MELEGRVALVTGAASGLGRAIVLRFAQEGARVMALDRDPDGLAALLDALDGEGHVSLVCDVRDPATVEAAVSRAASHAGRLDVAVSCAGVRGIGDVYALPADEWETVIAINLSGTFYCCQSVARRMRESGGGSIRSAIRVSTAGHSELPARWVMAATGACTARSAMRPLHHSPSRTASASPISPSIPRAGA